MNLLHGLVRRLLLTITGSVALANLAYGAQPPDVVRSDAYDNTAMGKSALLNLVSGVGIQNTASGAFALVSNTYGSYNTASGVNALYSNTLGLANTAFGIDALYSNTGANNNTAVGALALYLNTGNNNTAIGDQALYVNTSGQNNTASGTGALQQNVTGSWNTASGFSALYGNNGNWNTAFGTYALLVNTSGENNTATGGQALNSNTTGNDNTAVGFSAMFDNQTGLDNTALGHNALATNQGGSNNIAVGSSAGYYIRGGHYNIEIGNVGTANDSGTIRIGTSSQQGTTYIAGINVAHVAGSAVYITSTGQLGVLASSERYKSNVASMGSSSERLKNLRPVTFQLKTDPKAGVQYGLIAEEVAKVYPELVIRSDKGQIEGVRYEELTPMLLNEIQRQQAQLHDMQQQLAELQEFRRSMQGRAANQSGMHSEPIAACIVTPSRWTASR